MQKIEKKNNFCLQFWSREQFGTANRKLLKLLIFVFCMLLKVPRFSFYYKNHIFKNFSQFFYHIERFQ